MVPFWKEASEPVGEKIVTPSSETTREQNNRYDTLASAGTVTMENNKDFETTSVVCNEPTKQTKNDKDFETTSVASN